MLDHLWEGQHMEVVAHFSGIDFRGFLEYSILEY